MHVCLLLWNELRITQNILNKLLGCPIDIINRLNTIFNLINLKLTFRHHLTPSSELRMSRLFSVKCHFCGNELAHGEETCQNWLTGSTTRFIHLSLLLRISIASLIHLVLRSDSCPNTFTWSQSIMWFSLVPWSVMADLFCCSAAEVIY